MFIINYEDLPDLYKCSKRKAKYIEKHIGVLPIAFEDNLVYFIKSKDLTEGLKNMPLFYRLIK